MASERTLGRQLAPAAGRRLAALLARLRRWYQLWHERQALANLDDRLLRDMGITRHQAMREAARPFWDDPLGERRW